MTKFKPTNRYLAQLLEKKDAQITQMHKSEMKYLNNQKQAYNAFKKGLIFHCKIMNGTIEKPKLKENIDLLIFCLSNGYNENAYKLLRYAKADADVLIDSSKLEDNFKKLSWARSIIKL